MTQSFSDAQQSANVAYDMTLAETNDIAQAADSYKQVMAAYMAKAFQPQPRQYIEKVREIKTVYNDWDTFTQAVDSIDCYGMMGDRD